MCSRTHDTGESRAYLGNLDRGVNGVDGGNGITTEERSNEVGEACGLLIGHERHSSTRSHEGPETARREAWLLALAFRGGWRTRGAVKTPRAASGAFTVPRARQPYAGRTAGVPAGDRRSTFRVSVPPFLRCDPVLSARSGPQKTKSFYCPFSRDRVTRPWDERPFRGTKGRRPWTRSSGPRSSGDFTNNFGPQAHDSTRRNPHFIRLTQARSPTRP